VSPWRTAERASNAMHRPPPPRKTSFAKGQHMAGSLLVHNVFFSLKDNSGPARDKLLAACRKYLKPHPGIVYFACGTLAEELKREVNDRGFDVGLHIVFENQAAHDRYQSAAAHQQFVNENRDTWSKVRVFDSTAENL
jgi:hypothetical protein